METVAIFGVGLIGGSFALALRKAGFSGKIIGASEQRSIQRALDLRIIDEAAPARQAAEAADLIYLAQPIRRIVECLPNMNSWAKPQALITDAGSTKGTIVEAAAGAVTRCQFLGAHPMAGRERHGVDAAEAELFEGRPWVLTPRADSDMSTPAALEYVEWVRRIGAIPVILRPDEHDRIVAYTSHLPQLMSTGLGALLAGRTEANSRIFGPALLDSTRLALSSYEIWGDILFTNREAVRDALESYIAKLEEFLDTFEPDPMRAAFERAKNFAQQLRETP